MDQLVVHAASLQGPTALAMFLLGMVAARRGLFSTLPERTRLLRSVQIIGFPVGLAGGLIYALLGADANTLATAVSVVTEIGRASCRERASGGGGGGGVA